MEGQLIVHFDDSSLQPRYIQVAQQIQALWEEEKLPPGFRLPGERQLAEELGISRGSVARAYQELAKMDIAWNRQGSGWYLRESKTIDPGSRKEQAMAIIELMIQEMRTLHFSFQDIKSFVQVKLMEQEQTLRNLQIAGIECNPEALEIYERQLLYVSKAWIHKIILQDLKKVSDPQALVKDFDLIITTQTHYQEIKTLIPGSAGKLLQAFVAPSPETLRSLSKISGKERVAIVTESTRFQQIIEERLEEMNLGHTVIRKAKIDQHPDLVEFLSDIQWLITPPQLDLDKFPGSTAGLGRFTEAGGRILRYSHQIERGSLMYLEEKILEHLSVFEQ
jgi:DNA-binding transcriptional regulator YhcF (GntR family)